MWWQYFLSSEWMPEQCIILIVEFMNVKSVGSWRNDEQEKYYWWSEKLWNWFLKQEKAVKKKFTRNHWIKKRNKSQQPLKPKCKGEKDPRLWASVDRRAQGSNSRPERLNQAVPNHVLVACRSKWKAWDWVVKVVIQGKRVCLRTLDTSNWGL